MSIYHRALIRTINLFVAFQYVFFTLGNFQLYADLLALMHQRAKTQEDFVRGDHKRFTSLLKIKSINYFDENTENKGANLEYSFRKEFLKKNYTKRHS